MDQETNRLVQEIQNANKVKTKVKKLLFNLDQQKSGFVQTSAFLQILELHKIKLTPSDQTSLKLQFEKKGGFVSYKEVLHYIQMNRELSDPSVQQWIFVNPVSHNRKSPQKVDVRSTLSSRQSNYSSVSSVDPLINDQAKKILNNSFQPITSRDIAPMQTVLEVDEGGDGMVNAEEIRLGDDFQSFNQRNKLQKQQSIEENLILKNLKKKQQAITAKPDQKIVDHQNRVGEIENGIISPLQPPIPAKKDGRRILDSPQKISNNLTTHNHDVSFDRRHALEYPNYQQTSNGLVESKSTRDIKPETNLPHKTKISIDYLKKVLETNDVSDNKFTIIRSLYDETVDFRSLNNLKKNLFESDKVTGSFLPIDEYVIIKNKVLKDKMQKTEPLLLQEIKVDDFRVDLNKLGEIIDLFNYFPVHVKKDKNKSNEVYYVMTSNQRGVPQPKDLNQVPSDSSLQNVLEIVWTKIIERFHTVGQAFRFFDINSNLKISYNEFYNGLDRLRVKISDQDALKVFSYLDKNDDGEIGYNEFCELCEEKRRKIDPFEIESSRNNLSGSQLKSELHYYSPSEPKSIYLSNVNIDHLDQLSKFKPLSKTKRNARLNKTELSTSRSVLLGGGQSYGKSSGLDKNADSINDIINQQYLKDFLKDQIHRNALDSLQVKSQQPRSIHNKTSDLRSKTVNKYILKNNFEREIEDLRLAKAEKNDLSFVDIQKKHHKIKKELSLPPINHSNANFATTIEDPLQSRNRNPLRLNSSKLSDLSHQQSQTLSLTPLKSLNGHKRSFTRNHQEILDEIHQMRMNLIDNIEKNNTSTKPTMTKREKEDILSTYFEAKKKLNAT